MALDSVTRPQSDVSGLCSVPGIDVGSGRISAPRVAQEPDVVPGTRSVTGVSLVQVPAHYCPGPAFRRFGRCVVMPALWVARGASASRPPRADLGQRIDGVSRSLPYSDLLALTSSGRRGEGVSDRGSWKMIAHSANRACRRSCRALISKRTRSLIRPAWCLDRWS